LDGRSPVSTEPGQSQPEQHFVDRSSSTLVSTLLSLRDGARTGVLEVQADGIRTFIYLDRGDPVFAEEESIGETLGRMLVRQGKLSPEQHVRVIERMTQGFIDNEQLRFGEVAVALGFLSAQEVQRALTDQVRWKIIRMLERTDHRFEFKDSASRLEGLTRFPLVLEALIMEACRWVPDDRRMLTLGGVPREGFVVLAAPLADIAKRYVLTPDEHAFLAKVDGTKRAPELIEVARDDDGALAVLTALVVSRGVALRATPAVKPRPAPAQVPAVQTPAKALSPQTLPMAIQPPNAAHRAVIPTPQQFVPYKTNDPAKERADRALAELRRQRSDASGAETAPRDPHEARLQAERSFQRGRQFLATGNHAMAHMEFQRAHQLQQESLEYELLAVWSSVLAAKTKLEEARGDLKRIASTLLKTDPNCAFGYYVLGEVALSERNEAVAKRALTHAVKLDASLVDAKRRLHMLTRR
jgi:hypothetical protein